MNNRHLYQNVTDRQTDSYVAIMSCTDVCENVCTGVSCMETETEADSSDMSECPHDDKPSTGMIVFDTRTTAIVWEFMTFRFKVC